ncbi:hypothetical protein TNIN_435811 [Trichonephila inaurata madagascariensis]|uniref:Uncharacterized protein n=1 Tax=Trichonephila inaurata madagascariensis TaxID=2747483 RepID=A0A8X6WW31_9ARAC|nr:hypothetical protein TNIN_435811 [Trichonephila inaurata madagascariensis]
MVDGAGQSRGTLVRILVNVQMAISVESNTLEKQSINSVDVSMKKEIASKQSNPKRSEKAKGDCPFIVLRLKMSSNRAGESLLLSPCTKADACQLCQIRCRHLTGGVANSLRNS